MGEAELRALIEREASAGLTVRRVPAGFAVSSSLFERRDGDRCIGYVVGPDGDGRFAIEDDGMTLGPIALRGLRGRKVKNILRACGAVVREDHRQIVRPCVAVADLPAAIAQFLAMLWFLDQTWLNPGWRP